MAGVGGLALGLGTVVVKALVEEWLGESLAAKLLGETVDITRGHLVSNIDAITVERVLRRKARELGPWIEYSIPDSDSRQRIVTAVAYTIKDVDAAILVEHSLSASTLTRTLQLNHKREVQGFTEHEVSMYRQLLNEVCEELVSVAPDLPGFNSVIWRTVLEHQNAVTDAEKGSSGSARLPSTQMPLSESVEQVTTTNYPKTDTELAADTPLVFITYHEDDGGLAERLGQELSQNGFRVWLADWNIRVGNSIVKQVNEGLENARFLILCYSDAPLVDPTFDREWMSVLARQLQGHNIRILPVRLSGGRPPAVLADIKYADLVKNWEKGMAALLRAMR